MLPPQISFYKKGDRLSALFHPYLCRERSGRHGDYYATYQDIKNALSTDERLIYLCLEANTTNNPYDNHAVVGYAYTQLRNVNSGRLASYLKICDGMVSYGRYMDMDVTESCPYWEVHF